VVDSVVVRVPDAYPVYNSTYRSHLEVLRGFLDPIANLHTVGRNGMHKYNNQDHSMYAAMLTVANLHGEAHDIWAVNSDFEYHEADRLRPSVHVAPHSRREPVSSVPESAPALPG